MVVQPIVALGTGTVAGYELLSRFSGPPVADPDKWFAAADRFGVAGVLTARVIARALVLGSELPTGLFLTVNVEPHLLTAPIVRDALRSLPRTNGTIIELTGDVRVADERSLIRDLDRIREIGVRVAVDDAGAELAGQERLRAIRPDFVKVDRATVAGLDGDPARREKIGILVELTGRLNADLLAVGVETEAERDALNTLGVPFAQGWFFGRPAPPWPVLWTPRTRSG